MLINQMPLNEWFLEGLPSSRIARQEEEDEEEQEEEHEDKNIIELILSKKTFDDT